MVTVLIIGRKGVGAIASLFITTLLIFAWFIPNLFNDSKNLLWYEFSTILSILVVNQIIGHGWNRASFLGLPVEL